MHAVCQHGFRRQQAMCVVDVGVRVVSRELSMDESNLGCVFTQMGLDWEVSFFGESAEAREQLGGARGYKARGDDWRDESVRGVDGVDMGDRGFRIFNRLFR